MSDALVDWTDATARRMLFTVELKQIIEDLVSLQILFSKGPRHLLNDFLALLQQSLPHFHELGSLHNILPVINFAWVVRHVRHLDRLAQLVGTASQVCGIDAKRCYIFATFLCGKFVKPIRALLVLKDGVLRSQILEVVQGLVCREEVAIMLLGLCTSGTQTTQA